MRWRRRRPRLHRQLFSWFALTIVVTILSVYGVFRLFNQRDGSIPDRLERVQALIGVEFAEAWDDPPKRDAFAKRLGDALSVVVRIDDAQGRTLRTIGGVCPKPDHTVIVRRGADVLGRVHGCYRPGDFRSGPLAVLLALVAACVVLWLAAAALAQRLTRPLELLIDVTRDLGEGKLRSRVRLGRHHRSELGVLAESVNDMAERIERQLREQRELLAVVSHEVRSPLARLRVCSEILRENAQNAQALEGLEREVSELDQLVGKLLASSRLDFGSIDRVALDPVALARTALTRRGLSATLLEDRTRGARCTGDPTLVARALDNLLDNAERHGSAAARVVVRPASAGEHRTPDGAVVFEVWDSGPGFDAQRLPNAFTAFGTAGPRRTGSTPRAGNDDGHVSLGLGLSLVRRIAEAHGGRAWAENSPGGGARVSLSVG